MKNDDSNYDRDDIGVDRVLHWRGGGYGAQHLELADHRLLGVRNVYCWERMNMNTILRLVPWIIAFIVIGSLVTLMTWK